MSALSARSLHGLASPGAPLRFATAAGNGDDGSLQWLLRRNRSMTPAQLVVFYVALCVFPVVIAGAFWLHGAPLVLPFASVELLALAAALLLYARHAGDREQMVLAPGRLTVECTLGHHTDHVEFVPAWVRVEPAHGDHSLIELSGQGKRIAVGRFVRPELRRALADELRAALRRCA